MKGADDRYKDFFFFVNYVYLNSFLWPQMITCGNNFDLPVVEQILKKGKHGAL